MLLNIWSFGYLHTIKRKANFLTKFYSSSSSSNIPLPDWFNPKRGKLLTKFGNISICDEKKT